MLPWRRFSVGVIVILVALLVLCNAYATPLAPENGKGGGVQVFVAADLTLPSTDPGLPAETFVVLQAGGLANHLVGTLFVFFPPTPCATKGALVTGTLSTNQGTLNGQESLSFTGEVPPDPCLKLGATLVNIIIGPAFVPPDPCVLTVTFPSGATVTYSGETVRFIVTTVTTTSSTTTLPS